MKKKNTNVFGDCIDIFNTYDLLRSHEVLNNSIISDDSLELPTQSPCWLPETSQSVTTTKSERKKCITPKLVAVLDRCQLSLRDSVYTLHVVVKALDFQL